MGFATFVQKEGGHSGILQNPSDPDATYRTKSGKEHQEYIVNLEESVGASGTVITDYQYEKNMYSDSRFLKDSLKRTPSQEEGTILVADRAYSGKENHDLAAEKKSYLANTGLSGKPVYDIQVVLYLTRTGQKCWNVQRYTRPTLVDTQAGRRSSYMYLLNGNSVRTAQIKSVVKQKSISVSVP